MKTKWLACVALFGLVSLSLAAEEVEIDASKQATPPENLKFSTEFVLVTTDVHSEHLTLQYNAAEIAILIIFNFDDEDYIVIANGSSLFSVYQEPPFKMWMGFMDGRLAVGNGPTIGSDVRYQRGQKSANETIEMLSMRSIPEGTAMIFDYEYSPPNPTNSAASQLTMQHIHTLNSILQSMFIPLTSHWVNNN
ncbi:hypothetical protein CAPTEDRAFT_210915 [Capitella teleta]|uniref:DOMON domain-containing protein n=1 Tax=Capitella teleta TaxID=283909 RepID=R7VFK3_CAPTE|nr:hypothetical protein CAPTEDRAFT_210915 [Capitella teleta]|eukprot:ELU14460.1 hypothetical protein CAPTEDRAFT_210915 [Capitella teleta]